MATEQFHILPLYSADVLGVKELPFHHKDPFDRLLISQAAAQQLTLITRDAKIHAYDGNFLWK